MVDIMGDRIDPFWKMTEYDMRQNGMYGGVTDETESSYNTFDGSDLLLDIKKLDTFEQARSLAILYAAPYIEAGVPLSEVHSEIFEDLAEQMISLHPEMLVEHIAALTELAISDIMRADFGLAA